MCLLGGVGAGLRNVEYPGSVNPDFSFDYLNVTNREVRTPPFESDIIFWG